MTANADPPVGVVGLQPLLAFDVPSDSVSLYNQLINSLNAQLLSGTATGPKPGVSNQWFSSSLKYVDIVTGPQARSILPFNGSNEEPSAWYANGLLNLVTSLGGSGPLQYYSCAGDPMVPENWSAPTNLFGSGTGGIANSVAEPNVYVEGETLYMTYLDTVANVLHMATASITAPTVWTTNATPVLASAIINNGATLSNAGMCKSGSTYYLFLEGNSAGGGNGAGLYLATSLSLSTAFTLTSQSPLTSVKQHIQGPSNPMLDADGVTWVMFGSAYAGLPGVVGWPAGIWRMTNTNIATDTWVTTDMVVPPILSSETSGCCDATPVMDPVTGAAYMLYTGVNFRFFNLAIQIVPMAPRLMLWTGVTWKPSTPGFDSVLPACSKERWIQSISAAAFPAGSRTHKGRGSPATHFSSLVY